jgi:hypothetical protein
VPAKEQKDDGWITNTRKLMRVFFISNFPYRY